MLRDSGSRGLNGVAVRRRITPGTRQRAFHARKTASDGPGSGISEIGHRLVSLVLLSGLRDALPSRSAPSRYVTRTICGAPAQPTPATSPKTRGPAFQLHDRRLSAATLGPLLIGCQWALGHVLGVLWSMDTLVSSAPPSPWPNVARVQHPLHGPDADTDDACDLADRVVLAVLPDRGHLCIGDLTGASEDRPLGSGGCQPGFGALADMPPLLFRHPGVDG